MSMLEIKYPILSKCNMTVNAIYPLIKGTFIRKKSEKG